MNETSPQKNSPRKEGNVGPVIGTLIIVILLIVTALYIWSEHLNTIQTEQKEQNVSTTTTIIYSTSTAPIDIQNDLRATPVIKTPGF